MSIYSLLHDLTQFSNAIVVALPQKPLLSGPQSSHMIGPPCISSDTYVFKLFYIVWLCERFEITTNKGISRPYLNTCSLRFTVEYYMNNNVCILYYLYRCKMRSVYQYHSPQSIYYVIFNILIGGKQVGCH